MVRHFLLTAAWLVAAATAGCAFGGRPAASDVPAGTPDEAPAEAASAGGGHAVARVLLFLPDRLMDALDVVSVGVGLGFGFDVNVHVTRFVHAPALGIYWVISPVQWRCGRNLSASFDQEFELGLGPLVMYKSEFFGAGTNWGPDAEKEFTKLGLASLRDPMLAERFRSPWAVGAAVGPLALVPVRAEAEVHPEQIADFIVGLVTLGFVDLMGDDWASP